MFISKLKKSSSVVSQHGRSMIEMLGVLAIVGVLSMGGVAGYSKAMGKFRVNRASDQISQLAQNIRTLYLGQRKYSDLTETVIKKSHLAPEEMYEDTSSLSLVNPFGGSVWVGTSGKKSLTDSRAFVIYSYNIPQEACIEILTQDWGTGTTSGLIAFGAADTSTANALFGCSNDSGGTRCSKAGVMSVAQAVGICTNEVSNGIMWKFY